MKRSDIWKKKLMGLLATRLNWIMIIGRQVSLLKIQSPDSEYISDDILQKVLPEELQEGAPSGFAMTGHIGEWFRYTTRAILN